MFIQILIPDSGITDHGMGFDDLEFRIGQLSGLPQQFVGQLQLADIIIETAEDQCIFSSSDMDSQSAKAPAKRAAFKPWV